MGVVWQVFNIFTDIKHKENVKHRCNIYNTNLDDKYNNIDKHVGL